MSQGTASMSLIRLSVSSGTRRADLGVPGGIPVAELIPDLARELGALDPHTATRGFRLLRSDGQQVDDDRSLAAQGIEDGAILSLQSLGDAESKVYDDVVEAVADLVETQFAPWTAANSSGTALGSACLLFHAAAFALFTSRDNGALVAALSGALAALLLGAGAVLVHVRRLPVAGAVLAGTSLTYAAVSGLAIVPSFEPWPRGMLPAGVGVVVAALAATAAVAARHRTLMLAGVVFGGAMAVVGAFAALTSVAVTSVCAVVLVLAVLAGSLVPWTGLTSSRLTTHAPRTDEEITRDVPPVDPVRVGDQVTRGHDVMTGLALASSALSLLVTPPLVASGLVGTLLVLVGSVAALLRTRHCRTRAAVLVTMVGAVLVIGAGAVAAAQAHPGWRAVLALTLALSAAVVVALVLLLPRTRVALGRVADALEGTTLVALLPLAAKTIGLF